MSVRLNQPMTFPRPCTLRCHASRRRILTSRCWKFFWDNRRAYVMLWPRDTVMHLPWRKMAHFFQHLRCLVNVLGYVSTLEIDTRVRIQICYFVRTERIRSRVTWWEFFKVARIRFIYWNRDNRVLTRCLLFLLSRKQFIPYQRIGWCSVKILGKHNFVSFSFQTRNAVVEVVKGVGFLIFKIRRTRELGIRFLTIYCVKRS